MTHFFMTGPTTVFPKTKRSREKEPYSDEESDDVSTKGGNGRYYVDRVGGVGLYSLESPHPKII